MAAEAARRPALLAAGCLALVALAATGLVVTFRDGTATVEARDEATGERLEASLAVELEDQPVAAATVTLRLTNPTNRPAYFRGNDCAGPGNPAIGPRSSSAAAQSAGDAAPISDQTLRERLIANGERDRLVTLDRAGGELCDTGAGVVTVEPGETLAFEYATGSTLVDRAERVRATARVIETTRRGREIGRIRLAMAFDAHPDAGGTVDQAVDAFLVHPEVADVLATADDQSWLTQVHREPDGWRIAITGDAGFVRARVLDAALAVVDVEVSAQVP